MNPSDGLNGEPWSLTPTWWRRRQERKYKQEVQDRLARGPGPTPVQPPSVLGRSVVGNIFEQQLEGHQKATQAFAGISVNRLVSQQTERPVQLTEVDRIIQARLIAKKERDRLHKDTDPDVVWGSEAGRVCKDFTEFMARQTEPIPDATVLISAKDQWTIRGYGVVGIFTKNSSWLPDSASQATNLLHNVFLCEDNQLRFYANESVEPGQALDARLSHPFSNTSKIWYISEDYYGAPFEESDYYFGRTGDPLFSGPPSLAPTLVESLPVDNTGQTHITAVGRPVLVPASAQRGMPNISFEMMNLDDILLKYTEVVL